MKLIFKLAKIKLTLLALCLLYFKYIISMVYASMGIFGYAFFVGLDVFSLALPGETSFFMTIASACIVGWAVFSEISSKYR